MPKRFILQKYLGAYTVVYLLHCKREEHGMQALDALTEQE